MKRFISYETQVSNIVDFYKTHNYKILADLTFYRDDTVDNIAKNIDEYGFIVIIRRLMTTELLIPNDCLIPNYAIPVDANTNSKSKLLFKQVADNLRRAGIRNQALVLELELASKDEIEDTIKVEELVILEKINGIESNTQ